MTERVTESLVRDILSKNNFYAGDIVVEEQKSQFDNISLLFKRASKSGKEFGGFPEFIIHSNSHPDFLIIVECKTENKNHGEVYELGNFQKEPDYKLIKNNATDGVLHYASKASSDFNVIAIAVSGTTEHSLKITCYLAAKKSNSFKLLYNTENTIINNIIPFRDFVHHSNYDSKMRKMRETELISEAKSIHQYLYENAKITENDKPLLVAGTLLALKDEQFISSYDKLSNKRIMTAWFDAIGRTLEDATIPNAKIKHMHQSFTNLKNDPNLASLNNSNSKSVIHGIIEKIHKNIFPYMNIYQDADIMGLFYGEFLKYSSGDGKGLGIILTPKHITELCCDLANVTKTSKVLDPCAGTGGFLISAMHKMTKFALSEIEIDNIKRNNLVGIEQMPHMYTIACTNMILRGDGKSNLYQGSCFDEAIFNAVKDSQPTVGLINPPYAQGNGKEELVFVNNMLNLLKEGSYGVALIPCSCGNTIGTNTNIKQEILTNHTLLGVMTMPVELFRPTAVNTCVMVFEAGKPHRDSNVKTWFADFKNDGYEFNKDKGRHDKNETWNETALLWVEHFRNREIIDGFSVARYVTEKDEWATEAYLTTDYSGLNDAVFQDVIKHYRVHKMTTNYQYSFDSIDTSDWKSYKLPEIFTLVRGQWNKQKISHLSGKTPLVTSTSRDNGIDCFTADDPTVLSVPCLTVANNGSVGETFIQDKPFNATADVTVLVPHKALSENALLFIASIVKMEKHKFHYGFKWNIGRMKESSIKLPVKNGLLDVEFMEKFIDDIKKPITVN
jgi:type I restriction-modification system DNA methylase subunit